jgi:hypothetical protein
MKKIFFISVLSSFFLACEKEIELKSDEITPRIVINSLFTANDTIHLEISESRSVLYEGTLPRITNATAKLFDANNVLLGTFTHAGDGNYFLADPKPIVGARYNLEVSAIGFETVKATSETPSLINITSIDTNSTFGTDPRFNFALTFSDNPDQKNYYGVSVYTNVYSIDPETSEKTLLYTYSGFNSREFYIINGFKDVDGEIYGGELYFSDESFNGQTIVFDGANYPFFAEEFQEIEMVIGLISMSEDLFKYNVTYSKYLEAQGDFFAEPVRVYSNVENGFGIFGGSSVERDTIFF